MQTQENVFIAPIIDVVFKALFGKPNNQDMLKSLLMSITGIPKEQMEVLEYLNSEIPVDFMDAKESRLDLRIRLADGTQVDIEIQFASMKAFNERILFYWSRMYSSEFAKGSAYEKLHPCIVINLLNFKLFSHDKMHSVFHITEDELGLRLTNHLEMHYVELPKLNLYNKDRENKKLTEWVEFLKVSSERELIDLKTQELSNEIKKAFEELEELRKDPEMREIALSREIALRDYNQRMMDAEEEGLERGLKQGLEQGIEQGEEKAKIKIAKKLKDLGNTAEFIAEVTGLSINLIQSL